MNLSDGSMLWTDHIQSEIEDNCLEENEKCAENESILNGQEMAVEFLENRRAGKIEYNGFCLWTLANCNGLLLKFDPPVVLAKFKSKLCSFRTFQVARLFADNPDE